MVCAATIMAIATPMAMMLRFIFLFKTAFIHGCLMFVFVSRPQRNGIAQNVRIASQCADGVAYKLAVLKKCQSLCAEGFQ